MRETPKEPRKRLDQDIEKLPKLGRGSLRSARKNQLGVRQLREACSGAQGTRKDMAHQSPTTKKEKALEIDDDLGTSTYEGKPGTTRRVAR